MQLRVSQLVTVFKSKLPQIILIPLNLVDIFRCLVHNYLVKKLTTWGQIASSYLGAVTFALFNHCFKASYQACFRIRLPC